ncbi:hypothetical protein HYC85_018396 [Camellia sinensis]|uniref:Uncharacterized protein n=1 Tax=Camellia sinensis TaxID=4442 RepID=A0A7J7GU72_CAMSI|nr:hypothetical protein HYC85_018396 [Camellia sinensis]
MRAETDKHVENEFISNFVHPDHAVIEDLGTNDHIEHEKIDETVHRNNKPHVDESDSVLATVSRNDQKHRPSNLTLKPHSGRDRFKLQQESLGHKRFALKFRREGRIEESKAEFQVAKALEAQLDDSAKSSVSGAKPVDDVGVEDFLDPQLLFALKDIGFEDDSTVLKGPEKPEPIKSVADKGENSSRERIRLEAEKVKAINLKRAGKQAEALDALRCAKVLEKKLSSLAS